MEVTRELLELLISGHEGVRDITRRACSSREAANRVVLAANLLALMIVSMSFARAAAPARSRTSARRWDTPRILEDPFAQISENPRLITVIYLFAFPSSLSLAK